MSAPKSAASTTPFVWLKEKCSSGYAGKQGFPASFSAVPGSFFSPQTSRAACCSRLQAKALPSAFDRPALSAECASRPVTSAQ